LIPGQSFTFGVVFAPNSAGSVTGSLSVVSNASNSPLTISLGGSGTAAGQLVVTPTTLDFGSIVVGTSTSLTGTLSATGSSVTVSSATSNSSEFTLSGVSFPFTLAAGQTASLAFTFTPQASGTDTASISFFSNASNSPTVESLSGSGALSPLHSVDLSWSPSTSAVVGYNIYRGGTSGGPYAKINSALNTTIAYTDATAPSRSDILLRDYSSGCERSGECVLESGPSRGSYSLSIGTAESFGAQMGPNVFPNSTSTIFRRSERQGSCFLTASMLEGRSLVKIVFRVVQIVRDNQHGAEAARVNGCSRQVPCCFP